MSWSLSLLISRQQIYWQLASSSSVRICPFASTPVEIFCDLEHCRQFCVTHLIIALCHFSLSICISIIVRLVNATGLPRWSRTASSPWTLASLSMAISSTKSLWQGRGSSKINFVIFLKASSQTCDQLYWIYSLGRFGSASEPSESWGRNLHK